MGPGAVSLPGGSHGLGSIGSRRSQDLPVEVTPAWGDLMPLGLREKFLKGLQDVRFSARHP